VNLTVAAGTASGDIARAAKRGALGGASGFCVVEWTRRADAFGVAEAAVPGGVIGQ